MLSEHTPDTCKRTADKRTAAILTQQHSSFTKKRYLCRYDEQKRKSENI